MQWLRLVRQYILPESHGHLIRLRQTHLNSLAVGSLPTSPSVGFDAEHKRVMPANQGED